jgi:hypothetical protein
MVEDRQALLERYRQSRADLLAAIDGLSEEQMTTTLMDGWSVKDHLAHLAFWDDIRASEVARISTGYDSAWRMSSEEDEAQNKIVYTERRSLSLEQVRWEIDTSRQRLLDAIGSATPRGLDPSLYGEAGLVSGHENQHTGWIRSWRREKGF